MAINSDLLNQHNEDMSTELTKERTNDTSKWTSSSDEEDAYHSASENPNLVADPEQGCNGGVGVAEREEEGLEDITKLRLEDHNVSNDQEEGGASEDRVELSEEQLKV